MSDSMPNGQRRAAVSGAAMPHCCLCGREIEPIIARLQANLQPRIIRALVANFPVWTPESDVCPECMTQVVAHARRDRSTVSLQYELGLPYPVYSRDETAILPSPLRVRADTRYTGRGVTVAFLDSGFSAHPDIAQPAGRIKLYVDATGARPVARGEFDDPPIPQSWHGTMTSAIAIGNGACSGGLYRGLAPEAQLVAVKTGYRGKRIAEADILRALTWVVDNHERHGIRVVSVSLGGDRPSDGTWTPLDEMVEEAAAQGLVVVCASGNDARAAIYPPASAPSAITVGGLDDQNALDRHVHGMYKSNWGTGVDGAPKPDVIAPAIWVAAPMVHGTETHRQAQFLWDLFEADDLELVERLKTEYARARFSKDMAAQPIHVIRGALRGRMNEDKLIHRHYQHVDGTSMSAPFVTGVVAQMLQANPKLRPAQVKDILISTAQPLEGVPAGQQGHGVVSGGAAVARALRLKNPRLRKGRASPHIERGQVTFTLLDGFAQRASVAGTFNGWQPGRHPLTALGGGAWQARVPVAGAGRMHYKFVLDDARWTHDPENAAVSDDGCGGYYSVLTV